MGDPALSVSLAHWVSACMILVLGRTNQNRLRNTFCIHCVLGQLAHLFLSEPAATYLGTGFYPSFPSTLVLAALEAEGTVVVLCAGQPQPNHTSQERTGSLNCNPVFHTRWRLYWAILPLAIFGCGISPSTEKHTLGQVKSWGARQGITPGGCVREFGKL